MTVQSGNSLVKLIDVEVGYGGRAFLPPISVKISRGEQWALLGPNGAGKSTLLRSMLGLQPTIAGRVEWAAETNVGYVPQRSSIDESMPGRVLDIVRSGVDQKWSFLDPFFVGKQADAVARAMKDANVTELSSMQYGNLSEGQKQRVLVARALASDPELIVLDEPTAAMDINAERDVFELLNSLRQKRKVAIMIVSHQLTIAAQFATHALLIDKDRRFALCGTMHDVALHPEAQARYGIMLTSALEESSVVDKEAS
jgi:zinc transport system ATP-binding protein